MEMLVTSELFSRLTTEHSYMIFRSKTLLIPRIRNPALHTVNSNVPCVLVAPITFECTRAKKHNKNSIPSQNDRWFFTSPLHIHLHQC